MSGDHGEPRSPRESSIERVLPVSCPYCGEEAGLSVDPAGGAAQEYVEDCEVCCRPWAVRLTYGLDGAPSVEVRSLDEG